MFEIMVQKFTIIKLLLFSKYIKIHILPVKCMLQNTLFPTGMSQEGHGLLS
jgi:hypothetical protein